MPPKTLPRPDPIGNPHKEWTRAIRANNPQLAGSNFEYSVPFTEMVSLGTMAILVGNKFTWDPIALKTSRPDAMAPFTSQEWSAKLVMLADRARHQRVMLRSDDQSVGEESTGDYGVEAVAKDRGRPFAHVLAWAPRTVTGHLRQLRRTSRSPGCHPPGASRGPAVAHGAR